MVSKLSNFRYPALLCLLSLTIFAPATLASHIASTPQLIYGQTAFNSSGLAGFRFNVTETVFVDRLGIWDSGLDGLLVDHDIAIFEYLGDLVVETSMTAGSAAPLEAGTRWTDVALTQLDAGVDYTIVATDMCTRTSDPGDECLFGRFVDYHPVVNQTHLFSDLGTTEVFAGPYSFNQENNGYLGPNFSFIRASEIPVPSSVFLTGLGILGIGGMLRKRRR